MTITKTADLFTQQILEELAEAEGITPTYEEMRAQVRGARQMMLNVIWAAPDAPFAQIRQAFIKEYTGLDFDF